MASTNSTNCHKATAGCNRPVKKWLPLLLLISHATLLAVQGYRNAPMYDEVAHLPSGLSHWELGNFDLYRVNPPLIRMLAAVPLLALEPEMDWSAYRDTPFSRLEFEAGRKFVRDNGDRSFQYFTFARWMLIPISLLGAWVCFLWAKELYGEPSGIVALCLWCFCSNLLGWGATLTPDAGAAAFGVLAAWLFWKWLRNPNWSSTLLAGLGMGLAELTKSSWIILFGLWPVLWAIWRFAIRRTDAQHPKASQLAVILMLSLYLLGLGYGLEKTPCRLDQFTFISETFGGEGAHDVGGNRFTDTFFGAIPIPLPANYVRGIDVQKYDFEVGKWSFLRGEQKKGGWWYYYLYALMVKTSLGTLCLFTVSCLLLATRSVYRVCWRDEIVLLLPAIAVLVLVSSQAGFNRYIRYVIPSLPFLYISTARIGRSFALHNQTMLRCLCVVALTGSIVSNLSVFPYSLSYFNYAVGGPVGGKEHIIDANIDWGQDLLVLKTWLDEHPEADPIGLAYFGILDPEIAGIKAGSVPSVSESGNTGEQSGPQPGWYAVSVNHLMGYRHFESDRPRYTYFQQFEPFAMAGYSIYIFHLSERDVERPRHLRNTNAKARPVN